MDPFCSTILEWIICVYRFPPCQQQKTNFKLLLPCCNSCDEILRFFTTCYLAIEQHVNNITRDHLADFACCVPGSYYDGYDVEYFVSNNDPCFDIPRG